MGQPSAAESLLKKSIATSTSINFRARKANSQSVVNPEQVFLLPFHIKLGL
jgi:hypothetical protein